MVSHEFMRSAILLFVLLNPFLLSIYLIDLIHDMTWRSFAAVLIRGAVISSIVFISFALLGDFVFTDVLQVRFASFLIFGGLLFLIVSIRSFFIGADALRELRGKPGHVAGSIAMPFMIGPGTISASISAGSHLSLDLALPAILILVIASVVAVLALKQVYDYIRDLNEAIITRYIDIMGRIMSLATGTIAVEMILNGIERWLAHIQ